MLPLSSRPHEVGTIVTSTLYRRHWSSESLTCLSHAAMRGWSQDLNPDSLAPQFQALNHHSHCHSHKHLRDYSWKYFFFTLNQLFYFFFFKFGCTLRCSLAWWWGILCPRIAAPVPVRELLYQWMSMSPSWGLLWLTREISNVFTHLIIITLSILKTMSSHILHL